MSYHHNSDFKYLEKLREKFQNKKFADYGFNEEDLGESSKRSISKNIQHRLWTRWRGFQIRAIWSIPFTNKSR